MAAMRWSLEMLEATWRRQGLAVERGGMVRAMCRGEVVEIPCELVGRAGDGSARVCVAGRVEEFGREEMADALG
jgi:hypothetical protein